MKKSTAILAIVVMLGVGIAYWTGMLFPESSTYTPQLEGLRSGSMWTFLFLGILPFLLAIFLGYLVVCHKLDLTNAGNAEWSSIMKARMFCVFVIVWGFRQVYSEVSSWGYVRGAPARQIGWSIVVLGAFCFIMSFVRKRKDGN